MEQQQSKKWLWIILAIVLILLFAVFLWYFLGKTKEGGVISRIFPFGTPSEDTVPSGAIPNSTGIDPDEEDPGGEVGGKDVLFRQLTKRSVAGVYTFERDGLEYARYISAENGNAFEVNIQNGEEKQLTNTTIPRIAIADWADSGNAVVLRYLEKSELSTSNIVKTYLGRLRLPLPSSSLPAATTAAQAGEQIGSMEVEFLPDDITALSVAPDGKNLFYLMKVPSGVSGSIINLGTKTTKEVFRNTFSEWLPQLLNNDNVILSSKPSGTIPGYSYRYVPETKALERLIRGKNGLTTLGNMSGSRILYGENTSQGTELGLYSTLGFSGDEGTVFYEKAIPFATLPEKCAWLKDDIRVLCGSFVNTPQGSIPDLWYQGVLSFSDTFWLADTDTGEIVFLADPETETGEEFDVVSPTISTKEDYFVFINKKDGTLWSLHLPNNVTTTATEATFPADLSPAEREDAEGSRVNSDVPVNKKP